MEKKPRPLQIAASVLAAAAIFLLPLGLAPPAHSALAITVLMALLWVGEAMPLHVTALLGTVLFVFSGVSPEKAFAPYFSPVIVVFFGGFMLARAMHRHGLDRRLVSALLSWFGHGARPFLFGLMLATAFLSFWVSNTATAAIMMPLAVVTFRGIRPNSQYAKAAVLGVAFAASIGGIGTIVGTPPNAIAVAGLAELGIAVTFFDWAFRTLPLIALLLPSCWLILVALYPPEIRRVALPAPVSPAWTAGQKTVLAIGLLAVALWMTSSWHHVPDASVAVIAVVLLYAFGMVDTSDARKIDWPVLLLLGGSMCMGAAIESTGLASQAGGALGGLLAGRAPFPLFAVVSVFACILTSFMSNTSTAALLVPIMTSLPAFAGVSVRQLGMVAGVSASFNFLTPAGTPPNAMAYSSGQISVWDMVKAGAPLTIIAILLISLMAWIYW